MYFNEEYIFDKKLKTLRKNVKIIKPGLLQEVLKKAAKRNMKNQLTQDTQVSNNKERYNITKAKIKE